MERRERIACVVLLLAYALLRPLVARALAFDLLDPEELLNLRLVRQLAADAPVGDLGRYWYTGVGGNTGAGSLVISMLYVPLGWFADAGLPMIRAMGLLWSVGAALVMAGLGRELFGRGGAAAGLAAALTLPPSWLAWSVTAYGNYVEAAVLTLLGAWLLLRGLRSERPEPWVAGAGAALSFSAWFGVSAAPPALVLGVVGAALLVKRPKTLAALVVGAAVGYSPALMIAPASHVGSPIGPEEVRAVFISVLSDPASWPKVFFGSLAAMPVLTWREVAAEDWAAGWQIPLSAVLLRFYVAGLGGLYALVIRPDLLGWSDARAPRRALAGALAVIALAIPGGLTAVGVGPDGLGVEQLYFFDGRRAALVYPIIALGLAGCGHWLWSLGLPGRIAVGLFGAATLANAAMILAASVPPPTPFHPERYLVCPAVEPVDEASVCVGSLWEDQVPVLEALVLRPELEPVGRRRDALLGFGALMRDEDRCDCSGVPAGDEAAFGFGAAVETGCSDDRAAQLCAEFAPGEACDRGRAFGAEHR